MLYDPQNFLHSYCQFAAARAGTTGTPVSLDPPCPIAYPASSASVGPFNLFLNQANEQAAQDPYAVIRQYSSTHERANPRPRISCQLKIVAAAKVAGWFLANSLFRCFVMTNQEKELRGISLDGFKLADNSADGTWRLEAAMTSNGPGQIGADDRGRIFIVSNFDLAFCKLT